MRFVPEPADPCWTRPTSGTVENPVKVGPFGSRVSVHTGVVRPDRDLETTRERDGQAWRIAQQSEVTWIYDGTEPGLAITSAIPPVFEAYATLALPGTASDPDAPKTDEELREVIERQRARVLEIHTEHLARQQREHAGLAEGSASTPAAISRTQTPQIEQEPHSRAVVEVLRAHTAPQTWWLGYLDTGASDVVFVDAPRVEPYGSGWTYVMIEAGPEQASSWRTVWDDFKGVLPDLMFAADRSWLVSTLWDDDWTCIGGTSALITAFQEDPELGSRVRPVELSAEDATPPGHQAL